MARGGRRRCPSCGVGPLFRRGLALHDRCPACGRKTLSDPGDPWAFFVVVDRLFVLVLIVILYFRLAPRGLPALLVVFGVLFALFVLTTPHRLGLCVGLVQGLESRSAGGDDAA